jgi:hypothetical protein
MATASTPEHIFASQGVQTGKCHRTCISTVTAWPLVCSIMVWITRAARRLVVHAIRRFWAESGRTKPWLFVTTELLSGRSGASPTLNNLPMQRALDLSLVFHKAVSGDGIQYVPFGAVRIKQSPGKSEWQARGPCACTKLLVMHSAFHRRCLDIHGRNADCSTPLGPSCVDRPKRWMPSRYTVFTCSLLHVTQRLWPL